MELHCGRFGVGRIRISSEAMALLPKGKLTGVVLDDVVVELGLVVLGAGDGGALKLMPLATDEP